MYGRFHAMCKHPEKLAPILRSIAAYFENAIDPSIGANADQRMVIEPISKLLRLPIVR